MRGNPLVYLFGTTWKYSEGNRKVVVIFWILLFIAKLIDVFFQPLVLARMINIVQIEGITSVSIKKLFVLLGWSLVGTVAFWAFHGTARILEQDNAFRARTNYRQRFFRGVMTLPMEWHVDHHSGDTIDRIGRGAEALYTFSENSFQIICSIVELVVCYCVLVYFSRPAAITVLVMVVISMAITMCLDRILMRNYTQLIRAENNVSESVFDAISNISTVITLRVEKLVFAAIMRKVEKPYELRKRTVRISEFKWFLTNFCSRAMAIIVFGVYFWQHRGTGPGVLVGSVYLLSQYMGNMSQLFFGFTNMYADVLLERARVLNAEELANDFQTESFANHVLPPQWQRLEMRNLNFSYHREGSGEAQLKNVSLVMARGERIAFVGESGSGKTTLLKVMRDLYHPQTLDLSVDGQTVPDGFVGIARAITLVPQDSEKFATTVLENITLGAEYDLEFVRRFTDMACFTDVVEGLPRKFDSSIKEKGVNLSGGQQQRLALARGLLACHDKDIVLLDEPTSSLDTVNEMRVYQNIFQGFTGKTIISSVHRLHLLPMFDCIHLFEEGQIIASGSLQELLAQCSEFQKLWQQYHDRAV